MLFRAACAAAVAAVALAAPVAAGANRDVSASGVASVSSIEERAGLGPGCISRREWRSVHQDMRKRRVHRIFDAVGELFGKRKEERFSRWYRQCRPSPGYHECRAVVDYYIGKHGAARLEGKTWDVSCSTV